MLKPKRKITKKEIQRDPFIENIITFKKHINQKKSIYTKMIIGVFAVFILSYFYTNNRSSNLEVAETLMSKAMVYVDLDDNDNARIYLQEVIDEYGNTDAGLNANYYLGRIYFIAGEYEMALPHFERYAKKGKNPLLSLSTYQGLVSIYKSKQDLANAIKYQKKSREKANSKKEKAWVSLGLAELTLANGDKNGAIKLISNVLENYEDNFELKEKELSLLLNNKLIKKISLNNRDNFKTLSEEIKYREKLTRYTPYLIQNTNFPFFDTMPHNSISLINMNSIRDFEKKANHKISHDRFRGNIYIKNIDPWIEFGWVNKQILINDCLFKVAEKIPRCSATNLVPNSDVVDINLPKKLREIYGHINMGIYLKPLTNGKINISDQITIIT